MAMEVDGAKILSAIAQSPSSFGLSVSQLNSLAISTLMTRLKEKSLDLVTVRSLAKAIGSPDFALTIDHMPAKDTSALVKRLDPKNPELRSADEHWQRQQISRLAESKVEPVSAQIKQPRALRAATPRSKVPKTGEVMKSKALKARASTKTKEKD